MTKEVVRERVAVTSGGRACFNEKGLPTAAQDVEDIVRLADTYLCLVRCTKCKRLKNKGYGCIHCGHTEGS
jgi:hypothetical protein